MIDDVMPDRDTDRHARMVLWRAVTLGRLEPQPAPELGVSEPQETADAEAI
jgi:hypothetical protein